MELLLGNTRVTQHFPLQSKLTGTRDLQDLQAFCIERSLGIGIVLQTVIDRIIENRCKT